MGVPRAQAPERLQPERSRYYLEAKGGKATPEDVPCEQTLSVSLSPKPDKGIVAIAAPWNALPRKVEVLDPTQKVYADAVRDFLKTKAPWKQRRFSAFRNGRRTSA